MNILDMIDDEKPVAKLTEKPVIEAVPVETMTQVAEAIGNPVGPAKLWKPQPNPQAHHKAGEYTREPPPVQGVGHHGKTYVEARGWQVCNSMFESIQLRSEGKKFLSYREADIAARKQVLDDGSVVAALMSPIEHALIEGYVGDPNSAYELRRIYNRGVEYKRTTYKEVGEAQKKKCDEYMAKVAGQLQELGLPLWTEEIQQGFHEVLCRPEYMTEEQYRAKIANPSHEIEWVDRKK